MLWRNVLTVMLALLVLSGSAGITLNAHYCNSTQTLQKSVLPFPIECTHGDQSCSACDNVVSDSCCHTPVAPAVHESGCCEDFLSYIKGLTDLELPKLQVKKIFNGFLLFVVRVLEVFSKNEDPKPTTAFIPDHSMPEATGKAFVISHHQLKLGDLQS